MRLLRLWGVYARLDLLFLMQDGTRFLTLAVSDAVVAVGALTGLILLAIRFDGMGAWTRDQILFMVGYGQVAAALVAMFFGYNLSHISRRLGRGQLDHSLIQPLPLALVFLTEGFNPFSGATALLPGLALLVWSFASLHLTLSPAWLGMLV